MPGWPGEIVSPARAVISAASRASVHTGRSAAGPASTSRATASATTRLRGVRPGRGRDRDAAAPPERTAERHRRTCSACTSSRAAIAALVSPASGHSTTRARPRRPPTRTVHPCRPPPAIPAPDLVACAFISRAGTGARFLVGKNSARRARLLARVRVRAFLGGKNSGGAAGAHRLLVGLVDNVLKPLLMGRGGDVPLAVVFVGVVGGLLAHGLIGLVVGPIVLTLGYELFRAWLAGPDAVAAPAEGDRADAQRQAV